MPFPTSVRLVEVGPRDGLQNEKTRLATADKVSLIEAVADAGVRTIECGSFVSAKWVPQMADTARVFQSIKRVPGVSYTALVPNLRGLEAALQAQVGEIAVFVSASEAFSQANINCSVAESLVRSAEVVAAARSKGLRVRGYVSCVLGCPFSGAVPLGEVARVTASLVGMGCYEVSLGDTVGVGTPLKAQGMLKAVAESVSISQLAVHYHDTWGQALANIFASLELGVSVIDSAVAGLGGCPYAPGAGGNVATEDVLYMLRGMGIETGINLEQMAAAGGKVSTALGRAPASKVSAALRSSSELLCGDGR